jgi:hypothetical protein
MGQQTLDRYIHRSRSVAASPKPTVSFINLPFPIRRQIYLHAGLVSESIIYLNYSYSSSGHCDLDYSSDNPEQRPTEETISARSSSLTHFLERYLCWPRIHLNWHCSCLEEQSASNRYECECDELPYQLLYVSQSIAKEVSTIFYSENHFGVFRDGLGGLSALSRLPPRALASMTSLSVCLNFYDEEHRWGRPFGPESKSCYHIVCGASMGEGLLSCAERRDEHVVKEWQALCKLLGPEIQPNQLKLSLTCDVADVEIAQEFVRLLLTLPPLRDCAVRLGSHYTYTEVDSSQSLTQLARQTVKKATNSSTQHSFRYRDLPKEIQTLILEYTELVSPFDLVWALNSDIAKHISSPYYEHRTFHSNMSSPVSSSCCQKCTPEQRLCACWPGQAAYSTTCTCWKFPLELFLVDRKMRRDAELIFYSRNRFLLLSARWNYSDEVEIYHFLRHLPGNGRRYLRSVTWMVGSLRSGNG